MLKGKVEALASISTLVEKLSFMIILCHFGRVIPNTSRQLGRVIPNIHYFTEANSRVAISIAYRLEYFRH